MTGRAGPIAWVGGLLGLATVVVLLVPAPAPVRLGLVAAFACLGPGSAIVAHLRRTDPVSATALTAVVSLTIFVGIATVTAWISWWHPRDTVLAQATLTVLSCATALVLRPVRARARTEARMRDRARPARTGRTG